MTRALIPIAAGLSVFAAIIGVYWLGGGDFERGRALGETVAVALFLGVTIFGATFSIRSYL